MKFYLNFDSERIGTLETDSSSRLSFEYEQDWCNRKHAFPLSQSLPLSQKKHGYPVLENYIDNLFPEARLREVYARAQKIPAHSVSAFLRSLSSDLPGALELVQVTEDGDNAKVSVDDSQLVELPLQQLEELLDLDKDVYQSLTEELNARFSIAGVQDKFTCRYEEKEKRIFIVIGRAPTTHLVKVNIRAKSSQSVFNEFLCLTLAESVGLKVNQPRLLMGQRHPVLILQRYDRRPEGERVSRIHQEDFCQATGTPLGNKYQKDGGPSFAEVYNLLRKVSSHPISDLDQLLTWLCFNILIGNNDTHCKNLSLIYEAGAVRLAPFYDILSTAVYGSPYDREFAFEVGGESYGDRITKKKINALEKELSLRPDVLVRKMHSVIKAVQEKYPLAQEVLRRMAADETISDRIWKFIEKRTRHVEKLWS